MSSKTGSSSVTLFQSLGRAFLNKDLREFNQENEKFLTTIQKTEVLTKYLKQEEKLIENRNKIFEELNKLDPHSDEYRKLARGL